MTTYYSSGKLLITGEYLILDGAESICIPTKKGQSLIVKKDNTNLLTWKSFDVNNQIWFESTFALPNFEIKYTTDVNKSVFLIDIIKEALLLNGSSKNIFKSGILIETKLDFDSSWGLGSSSTLLCNISKWLNVDAFQLHFNTTNGSGYDIACGLENAPLLYKVIDRKASYHKIKFAPTFKDQLFFIHLNKKQVSSKEVTTYNTQKDISKTPTSAKEITTISERLLECDTLIEFENLINKHERITARVLKKKTIRELFFSDYSGGCIKSLGAWGGDFILVSISKTADLDYFKNKGYTTIISWKEMLI